MNTFITHNLGYKLLSLILAIIMWFYVSEEIRLAALTDATDGSFRTYYQRVDSLES